MKLIVVYVDFVNQAEYTRFFFTSEGPYWPPS